ncbi:hypothetical protein [Nocardia sp. NPDC005366]|uniref:hypothetical protein n=1 Tax=Nocardia sp. NPDC005366 TaxID=3156878 RepID=UPI0033A09F4F
MTDEFAAVTEIHIHEDEWGMRCLHPLEAAAEVAADLLAAEAASRANRAPDGVGWTDVHVIAAPADDYAAAGLTFAQADAALTPIMPRIRRFVATASAGFTEGVEDPMGSYEDDAYCYGVDASCFVKLDGEEPLVEQIWYQADTEDPARLDRLRRAIIAVDRLVPSVIADYRLDCTGSVGDGEFLDRYMRMLDQEYED